ncbi:zinc finger protein ZFP2 [Procambarus clarkii]|uniref:zinc finger protein ZFP2 n=1 Tax=Procambarus clarkii TaxID=6728 RepID=UPI001E6766DE|nr:zinc finger protein 2 homolog [Procambarus clarkii]
MDMDAFLAARQWELEFNRSSKLIIEELNKKWLAMKRSFLYKEQELAKLHRQAPIFVSRVKATSKYSDGASSNSSSGSSSSTNSDVTQKNWKVKKKIEGSSMCFSNEQTNSPEIVRKRGNRKLTCSVCGLMCQHNAHFQIHMRTHTGEKPFKCGYCERAFAQKSDLTKHERIHTGEKPFKCDICDKAFAIGKSLQDHRRQHTGERPYECTECKRSFRNSSGLSEHRKTHRKQYERETLGKSTKKKRGVSLLKQRHSSDAARCSFCCKNFSNKHRLLSHIKMMHKKDVPYQCAKCYINYSSMDSLCLHVSAAHRYTIPQQTMMVPSYNCSSCVSKFTSQAALTEHMKDTGHTDFKCDVCDLAVEDLEKLIDHRWDHITEGQVKEKCKKLNKTSLCKGPRTVGGNGKNNQIKDYNIIKKQREEFFPGKLRVMTILPIEAFRELSGDTPNKDDNNETTESQKLDGTSALRKIRRMSTHNMAHPDSLSVMTSTEYVFRSCNKEKNKRMSLLANKKPSKHHESLNMKQVLTYDSRSTPQTQMDISPSCPISIPQTELPASTSYRSSASLQKKKEEVKTLHTTDDPLFVGGGSQGWDAHWLDEGIDIISI